MKRLALLDRILVTRSALTASISFAGIMLLVDALVKVVGLSLYVLHPYAFAGPGILSGDQSFDQAASAVERFVWALHQFLTVSVPPLLVAMSLWIVVAPKRATVPLVIFLMANCARAMSADWGYQIHDCYSTPVSTPYKYSVVEDPSYLFARLAFPLGIALCTSSQRDVGLVPAFFTAAEPTTRLRRCGGRSCPLCWARWQSRFWYIRMTY